MKERDNYMLCCGCGYAVKEQNMFTKAYKNTAICLCRKCATDLYNELADYRDKRALKNKKGGC